MTLNVLIACAFVPASVLQIRMLRSHLRSCVRTSSGAEDSETDRTVTALIGETVSIVCASVVWAAFTGWLTVTSARCRLIRVDSRAVKTAMSDPDVLNVAYSIGFYTYSVRCGSLNSG